MRRQFTLVIRGVWAAVDAARLRLRPILMTSLSFILGAMLLVLASGTGAKARHSIGTGIIGGMVAATTLALFFVPLFYYLIISFAERVSGVRAKTSDAACLTMASSATQEGA